jgi:hypothetical protein
MALGGEEGVERRAGMNTTCISQRRQGRCPQRLARAGVAPTQTELTEAAKAVLLTSNGSVRLEKSAIAPSHHLNAFV